ncbi:GreA/GreB family elongation factor [Actomonas aquatica]|uniref:GreA/GreB family elongation factor n=1 Tax=Actomonas aquatica TaxID=2866162 RepID=A0ABZ1C9K6_9BACT|nr:GreA/GreB family elongation factor [Opitutus sp. WL0086]WRQ88156.1 GreA/GreB family elongation factor [Opitutus sp. WL0086]
MDALLAELQQDHELQTRAALLARDEATNEESRAEGKYDTRGQEAAYLAESQAKIATELSDAITFYRSLKLPDSRPPAAIEVGSVVKVERPGKPLWCFIGSRAGGTDFTYEGKAFTVITPASPLGRLLLGKKQGDTVYLVARGKPQAHRIAETA